MDEATGKPQHDCKYDEADACLVKSLSYNCEPLVGCGLAKPRSLSFGAELVGLTHSVFMLSRNAILTPCHVKESNRYVIWLRWISVDGLVIKLIPEELRTR
jgi:hypothetical protein